ncbi:P-loop ATPase, Sll1717 family [Aquamicrobium zhengzhouense]|uniref:Uncharacterized protein n=1 Tax=Aquamicrobium zhengzhouense TaxID=2781738 RepID=A0ABS0SA89_9HYPH|nr:hypothetical protein [Aquamicrobium zhengzhouense]MBI1620181.1 hypothetical protein [Aquamicrobium zhengzhouense]
MTVSATSVGFRQAFFAYPASHRELLNSIDAACAQANATGRALRVKPWPQMDILGQNIADEVRQNIDPVDVLVCDVTKPNQNVYYEIGYAIGRGKSIAPVVNVSFVDAERILREDGLFDIIGYGRYENAEQLADILGNLPNSALSQLYAKPLNTTQPVFILDTYRKTDFRNAIVSAVKEGKAHYRSFDPVESPRFSMVQIISEVTASSGTVIPILAEHIDGARLHNLRASFLAGLSHGLSRQTLLIRQGPAADPLDYRDLVVTASSEMEISEKVKQFAHEALIAIQGTRPARKRSATRLQQLTLGASAAENEFRTLDDYFVETSEYVRTLRGEVGVVAGRKGSGKTAIFFMVRNNTRVKKNTYVTDLKPESHQLSLFRQELLKLVDLGVFDHTLAAFWYFLILSESLNTVRREYAYLAKRDQRALEALNEIEKVLSEFEVLESGDFTSRINRLSRSVIDEMQSERRKGRALSPERITNIVFRGGIMKLKELLIKHSDPKTEHVILFDNLDKGWPTNGVEQFDVRLVRLLIEALDKIRRDFDAADRKFSSVVFLRNDIYERLVDDTPDRGKAGQIRIDWNDRAKLRQVIYRRLQSSLNRRDASFEAIWTDIFTSHVGGRPSFEYCIDHCLMRPRFLLTIIENSIANAINRGHETVREEDLVDAVTQHSNYLVSDFGYEIRDTSGHSADLLFAFIGLEQQVLAPDVLDRLEKFGLLSPQAEEAFELLLWYGLIGILNAKGEPKYIYDYDYMFKRLQAEMRLLGDEAIYVINPALHVALHQ